MKGYKAKHWFRVQLVDGGIRDYFERSRQEAFEQAVEVDCIDRASIRRVFRLHIDPSPIPELKEIAA